jgi:glucose-1-phosphate cytidylyltransferase
MGTRISEESHLRPKPMIEIGGYPILWHIMKGYSACGFNDFVICCGYRGYMIKEYFANYYLHRSDVTFDFTDGNSMQIHSNVAEPWKITVVHTGRNAQTGGRVRRIRQYVKDEPFLLTYGDGVSNVNINALVNQHMKSGKTATITAIQPKGRFGLLDIDDEKDTVRGFAEKAEESHSWINAGFMVMQPEIFEYLDDDMCVLERKPMERLSREGRLGVYKHGGFWQCMDNQRDKGALENLWDSGNAPWKVW